jgi:hypothetical protein
MMRHSLALVALVALAAVTPPLAAQQMTLAPDTSYTTKRILPTPAGAVTAYEVWQGSELLGRVIQAPAGKWIATLPRSGIAFAPSYSTLKAAARRLVDEYTAATAPPVVGGVPGIAYMPAPASYGGAFGCWFADSLSVPLATSCRTTDQALRAALTVAMRRNGTGPVVERLTPALVGGGPVTVVDTVRRVDTVTVHTTITLPPDTIKPPPVVLTPDTVRTSSGAPELPRVSLDTHMPPFVGTGDTIFIGAVGQPMRCVGPNAAANCSVSEQRRILKCGTGYAAPACANYPPPPTASRDLRSPRVAALRRFPRQRGAR